MQLKIKSIISTFILSTLLLSSCASKDDKQFSKDSDVQEDMIETFDLSHKEFDKFKVEEFKPLDSEAPSVDVKVSEKNIKAKSKKIKKPLVKKIVRIKNKKVIKDKKQKEKKHQIKTDTISSKFQKPEDYPKEFLGYDKKSKKVWNQFEPFFFAKEKFLLSISYLGITAGHISLETRPQVLVSGKKAFHFIGRMKSAKFYEYIYTLNDTLETFIDTESFLPVKYTLRQRESGQKVDDLQVFDHKKRKTYFWYNRLKKGKTKKQEKESYLPEYFQDSFSALYFVRGLPLKVGDVYEFPVVTRAKMWLLKMKVAEKEQVKINGKWVDAIKIKAETHFPGVLKKKGDILFWYSADKYRKLLKFNAKVKIGSIEGELLEYSRGDERISYLENNKKDIVQ